FGDGDSSHNEDPTHVYPDTGIYSVQLIIQTAAGCEDTGFISTRVYPQPTISLSDDSVCRGISVDFQLDNPHTEIQDYLWNFGDGFTSSGSSPSHQYAAGYYYVTLKTSYADGKSCTSIPDSIRVLSLPGVQFRVNEDTQCFKGNQVCVTLLNQSSNIFRRRILFDDGYVDVKEGPLDSVVCYAYTDVAGGNYFIAVQMLDSNGCSNSKSSDTALIIYPEFDTEFTQSTSDGCFETLVLFDNTSNQSPPLVTEFYWDFGDGSRDSTNWSSTSHTYSSNGSFSVMLWAKNQQGCIDSSFGNSSVTNINYTVDAKIDSIRSTCSSNNRIYASQTPVIGATVQWVWNSGDTGSVFNSAYSYEFPGIYRPYVRISLNGCDSVRYLDTLTISGPYARIGAINNRYQCQISDTVYAANASDYFLNTQRGAFWDFGDAFAASCTTNYLAGLNATGNCRYATDTFNTKPMYDRNLEACYYIRLIVSDSTLGCSDTVTENISLRPPVAGPDSSSGLGGLFTIQTQTCLGPEEEKEIAISLSQTQPLCGKETYWVMWDSSCAAASGNFNSFWRALEESHNYDYANAPCDPNGYVSIGLIIQNGDDSLGNVCRDTAWYHQILRFNKMDPRFASSYDSSLHYCKGSAFEFYLTEQNQDSVNRVIWNWGDGTQTDTSSIDTVSHSFLASGTYLVTCQVFTTDGCSGTDSMLVSIGTSSSLSFTSSQQCVGDSFQIIPNLFYINDAFNYWADTSRIAANKEQLFFDLNDGNGYQNLGTQPWILSTAIKNYAISVAFRDSAMCWDTVSYQDSVRVFGVYAEFSTLQDTFLCPQAISFTDLSSWYDSLNMSSQPDDSLVNWNWSFGSGLANSSL
ncbi:MAG: PKD domain-containing protein, partial [Bacteroidota bacterium]|nr:PKD domain-containing protein [Bacteroidota bacterium]MDX5431109.1 PKD domain-containing protein [Bacteroidota bacterium]MDX5469862.1 PKD domain-containing protein [Bacteroidota bacterium]